MADFTGLNTAVTDLTTAVAAEVANLDKLWADYQAALAVPGANQAMIDAAAKAVEDQIAMMKTDLGTHTAP
jgi:hypothetical protein